MYTQNLQISDPETEKNNNKLTFFAAFTSYGEKRKQTHVKH